MTNRGSVSIGEVLVASRPLWWITMCSLFIAGSLLGKQEFSIALLIGIIYFLLPYNLLVYGVNDIFDYESDIRNERKTGIAHGKVLSKLKHPSLWRWIVGLNAPFLLALLVLGNIESNIFLFMIVYMALAYSVSGLRYKEIPFVDSLTSAFHYASPFLFGLLLFGSPDLYSPVFAAFFFWAVGNHAFGAIQDIEPDKAGGLKSIATKLGAGKTVVFVLAMYIAAAAAPITSYGLYGLAAAAWILPYFITVAATYKYRRNSADAHFKTAWRRFLAMNYIVGGIFTISLLAVLQFAN